MTENNGSDPNTVASAIPNALTPRQNLIKVARFAIQRAADKNLTQVAASLTFTTVLGLVPLLAVVLSLFTAFPLFADFRLALEHFLAANLMPPAVSANIMMYLNTFAEKASGLTAIGSLALILTSILLIRTIDDAFNNIWHVEHRRPLRQRMLVYWAIISLGPILMGASLWASTVAAQQSLSYVEQLHPSLRFILSVIPLLVTSLGFTALFMGVPNSPVNWKDALAGGIATAIVLSIMRAGFAYYLARFPSYTVIYGAFATLPIFLMWMYLSWLAILAGATIAATIPAIRQRRWDMRHYPGSTFVDALSVLQCVWQAQRHAPSGESASSLSDQTGLHQNELNHALTILKDLGYVANSENDDTENWFLACDPRTAELGPLVVALLIDDRQPRLKRFPQLPGAVAAILSGSTIRLESLFEHPDTLPETLYLGQNEDIESKEARTKEVGHVESQ